ncbi:MAG: BREX-1 system adenine-specific DNA-methyltransferase PglX [Kiritimatiellae bacterium]|nr:BREX-1 system adenine-specific DNA-methyltransferase PglX [Kiritimatiellia bacterium]
MAFDKTTRNNLAGMVAAARRLLVEEFTAQLQSIYGMQPDGKCLPLEKLPHLSDEQYKTAVLLRDRLEHLNASASNVKNAAGETINRVLREQAFTILNRFCALRMCEERGIVQECIRAGINSKGFQIYLKLAGSALGERFDRYRVFLECLEDELSVDLGVLFDRNSPQALLFPRENSLFALLDLLNAPAFQDIWSEDETIGWIYQYYNDPDERKKMRKASAAPRNSRELAVRNQFFTPRYVVEFLTDNTLGRIWYEMTQGETRLKEQCRYLVRRPTEVFLAAGEAGTEKPEQEGLSQEELLRQPVYIPHRPIKDPREIRMLDPACGSMHFGLYAFDLYEVIYEESWDNGSCPALQKEYASKDDFLKDVPRLIIENNIHGIDIDPRAVQIAGLSLWLRAQKTWQARGAKPAERPRVRRSNIVCAEPMPGSPEMLEEFVATLEQPMLGELVKTVFDKMKLAGEAGSLLKIEEEIRTAIDTARTEWVKQQNDLFTRTGKDSSQEEFFDTAEQQVIDALRAYAEQADAESYQRRLFADDAARGFAFIDLCRKRYDAVVMNPPFGEPAMNTVGYMKSTYPEAFIDVLAAFLERTRSVCEIGKVGAITSRACLYTKTLSNWRQNSFLPSVEHVADLGGGILDGAMVFACASTFTNPFSPSCVCTAFDLRRSTEPGPTLLEHIGAVLQSENNDLTYHQVRSRLKEISNARFLYNIPAAFWEWSQKSKTFTDLGGSARAGSTTYDDFRFLRLAWEVSPEDLGWTNTWVFFSKGGYFETYYNDIHLVVNWEKDGKEVGEYNRIGYGTNAQSRRASTYYRRTGITYPRRTVKGFSPRNLPKGCIFADKGPVIFSPVGSDDSFSLAYWNAAPVRALIHLQIQAGSFETGVINSIPWASSSNITSEIGGLAEKIWKTKASVYAKEETDRIFQPLPYCAFDCLQDVLVYLYELFSSSSARSVTLNSQISTLVSTEYSLPEIDLEAFEISEDDHRLEEHTDLIRPGSVAELGCSFLLGSAFGRWDIRYATGERQPPELPDPFDPLPVCPPGMLQNTEGLPAEPQDVPADYPLRISWLGILVDDENHPEDIVVRVRAAIEVIWKDRAEAIEQEACEILGVKTLRDYFRRPASFFADHLKRYSKSRRKAPIYWPLSTESGSYTLWIYYHRLSGQTLYSCINDFVGPKIRVISREVEQLQSELAEGGTIQQRDELEKLLSFRDELDVLRAELLRVAEIPFNPDLNDGVIINAAPLWKLFLHKPWQKACKECWDKLEAGDYDWAHLAYNIWPDRVREKCRIDKSLAIAHNLESVYQ